MGNVAASGGYWIALPGSKIIAQPATLTGSIGAMGGKFIFSGLCDKLGIQWDHVSTSENASMWSLMTPYTPLQQAQVDAWIQQIYDAFINRVAKGRRMTKEQVEKVARGRIWTGEQACALGLVDQLGGLHTAIALAKKESGLSQDAGVIIFPKNHTLFEELIDLFQGNSTDFFIPPRVGIFTHIFHFFQQCSALFSHQESVVYAPLREIR